MGKKKKKQDIQSRRDKSDIEYWDRGTKFILSDKDGYKARKLTPRECFRLQGFPDDYFDRAKEVCSDRQLYKQAGNSVTVPVVYEIAKRMKIGE